MRMMVMLHGFCLHRADTSFPRRKEQEILHKEERKEREVDAHDFFSCNRL